MTGILYYVGLLSKMIFLENLWNSVSYLNHVLKRGQIAIKTKFTKKFRTQTHSLNLINWGFVISKTMSRKWSQALAAARLFCFYRANGACAIAKPQFH
jgi:hypothetical protein